MERSVRERYAAAAQKREEALCCPVDYVTDYLKIIPQEILEKDYGCGDPIREVEPVETVLDLWTGGGKLCYIIAQVVGKTGRVIGVDCNPDMLSLSRRYQQPVAETLGYANVEFRNGLIQDLKLDLDLLAKELAEHPVRDPASWLALRDLEERLRREQPLIADESVDCVVSNCVLNLVRQADRKQLFSEIYRVLKPGGRATISDIVCDEVVPEHLRNNSELWSGCISGAFREDQFLTAFEDVGFHGIQITKRQRQPWKIVEGIEFRSMTVVAYKGKQGPCLERNQAVIYRGPFKNVEDDDGQNFRRGVRTVVGDIAYHLLQQPPYTSLFEPVAPRTEIPLKDALTCDDRRSEVRSPSQTNRPDSGLDLTIHQPEQSCCDPNGSCC